ncbi:hypothetical protein [Bacillus sp. FJAT-22090]|uniref:hypothetical protein n=1 Tax=Bacillus sp. FJAT-22090 TaxID=1581038 RepID=UPI001642B28F|nr:hypothetical protein [Bacillus sp. FJAT-22090]
MNISDEQLEYYADYYINENKEEKTGLQFHEYLHAMIILNRVVERVDATWQKEQQKKKSIKYYYQRIMRLIRTS